MLFFNLFFSRDRSKCLTLVVAVLLRALLGHHPLAAGTGVPQAAGQGGGGQAARRALPLVLMTAGGG